MLDTTVMNIALPAIQKGLDVSLDQLSWALNIYTILFACLTIPLGRMADIFGRSKLYVIGLVLFLLGSLFSGIAQSVAVLIIGRGIQSIGAAIVFPASMTIGISQVSLSKRTVVIGMLGVTQGLASALGPTIGGAVTQYLGWRGIFLINVPFAIVAIIMCMKLLSFAPTKQEGVKIDFGGMVLSMITLFSLILALTKGQSWGWQNGRIIILFIISAVTVVAFVLVEQRVAQPMMPLSLFKDKQFTGAVLTIILAQIALVALLVLMPSFFTNVMHKDELQAALMITPTSVMIFVLSPISGTMITKLGPRVVILAGSLLMTAGYVVLSTLSIDVYWHVFLAAVLIGAGFGINIGPITVLAAGNFKGTMLTASQSAIGVFRQIGTSLAVAIFVSALSANLVTAKHDMTQHARTELTSLAVPASVKHTALTQVKDQGKHKSESAATAKKNQQKLVQQQYALALTKAHAANAPQPVKDQILQQVTKQVVARSKQITETMAGFARNMKRYSHRALVKAFTQPYQWALPVVVLMGVMTLMFDSKRHYLDKQAAALKE
ncbi:EmrB QacA family drug resistance transporter [Furfurilactobacillus siliginis]|uniref:EmrB QacA family drug resistance transporter n=2 Tax=Furfurilactobacillus siliginis TaxID=348151 RepID=A0A0R2L056_9LACO|nr:EmrB QacA family drug resistance transporter [Furfurilactobacillus siliginis]GEK28364.1 MFS transporter [Furfurilactobacillus siliginis]